MHKSPTNVYNKWMHRVSCEVFSAQTHLKWPTVEIISFKTLAFYFILSVWKPDEFSCIFQQILCFPCVYFHVCWLITFLHKLLLCVHYTKLNFRTIKSLCIKEELEWVLYCIFCKIYSYTKSQLQSKLIHVPQSSQVPWACHSIKKKKKKSSN